MPGFHAGTEIIREAVRKRPDAPARTLARMLYARHPEVWPSLDTCRAGIRRVLGVIGKKARKDIVSKELFRKPRPAGWVDVIPDGIDGDETWAAFKINGEHRALVLSDIHIPFHDKQALEVALDYGADRKPTLVVLNGDIGDHYAQSHFLNDPRLRNFPDEIRQTKFFLKGLRKRFPKARIIYKLGNHEERYEKYMQHKAEELIGVDEFEFQNIFHLKDHKIELVKDKRPIRLGKLNILHGHEHMRGISAPVNPARGLFLKSKCHAMCGHNHQSSQHSETNVEQHVVSTWSTGCLCGLHPLYAPINNWNNGFAFVDVDKSGAFTVANLRIIDGRIY